MAKGQDKGGKDKAQNKDKKKVSVYFNKIETNKSLHLPESKPIKSLYENQDPSVSDKYAAPLVTQMSCNISLRKVP